MEWIWLYFAVGGYPAAFAVGAAMASGEPPKAILRHCLLTYLFWPAAIAIGLIELWLYLRRRLRKSTEAPRG